MWSLFSVFFCSFSFFIFVFNNFVATVVVCSLYYFSTDDFALVSGVLWAHETTYVYRTIGACWCYWHKWSNFPLLAVLCQSRCFPSRFNVAFVLALYHTHSPDTFLFFFIWVRRPSVVYAKCVFWFDIHMCRWECFVCIWRIVFCLGMLWHCWEQFTCTCTFENSVNTHHRSDLNSSNRMKKKKWIYIGKKNEQLTLQLDEIVR